MTRPHPLYPLLPFLVLCAPAARSQSGTAHLSEPRSALATATWGGKAFFGGGELSGSGTVDVHDSTDGSWTAWPLPVSRWGHAATAVAGQVLFAGGRSLTQPLVYYGLVDLVHEDDVLIPYCTGDGSGAACPCGSAGGAGEGGTALGDGLRCAGKDVVRLGVESADAGGRASWGPGLAAQAGWTGGDVRYLQGWYRDPAGGPCGSTFNLTPAVEARFYP